MQRAIIFIMILVLGFGVQNALGSTIAALPTTSSQDNDIETIVNAIISDSTTETQKALLITELDNVIRAFNNTAQSSVKYNEDTEDIEIIISKTEIDEGDITDEEEGKDSNSEESSNSDNGGSEDNPPTEDPDQPLPEPPAVSDPGDDINDNPPMFGDQPPPSEEPELPSEDPVYCTQSIDIPCGLPPAKIMDYCVSYLMNPERYAAECK